MAQLHRIEPEAVDLANFGKPAGFYDRQLRTLGAVSASQAEIVDVESGQPIGNIPFFGQTISFLGNHNFQPKDRSCFIHGDYKVDNLVYHKTEPRIIGVLE